ncbi:hypothetical protein [Ralstonia sp. SET104]|uniref:hypothetical protein n=1 Tax=Ralstonia sp. SET104 TaxID=2448774 RepID=UPI000F568196|nr:hypothetical protein [Ralstonia sp. SET104]GCB06433.1 hypothetical protein PSUB009319_40640 [Ralstonia sp. SET104]
MIAFILLALLTVPAARLIGARESAPMRWLWLQIAAIQVYVVLAIVLREAGAGLRDGVLFGAGSGGSGRGWFLAFCMSVATTTVVQLCRRATRPSSAAVLVFQLAVAGFVFYWATAWAGIQAFWLALPLVFILRRVNFGRRWQDVTGEVDATHYASSLLELSYTPGSDVFDIVFKKSKRVQLFSLPSSEQGVLRQSPMDQQRAGFQKEHVKPVKLPFAAQGVPLMHKVMNGYMAYANANSCFDDPCPNLYIRYHEEETAFTPTSTQTTYVPGSTSTGWTNDGQMVVLDTPGKTITTEVQTGPASWVPSGYCTVLVEVNLNDVCYSCTITTVPKKEAELIASVGRAINEKVFAAIQAKHDADRTRDQEAAKMRREASQQKAAEAVRQALEGAGFSKPVEGVFSWYRHDPNGSLMELIAADRTGRALVVASQGAERWQGLWQGAEAKLEGSALKLKVVDEVYRAQHLTERRFSMMLNAGFNELQTWCDRVNLLGGRISDA